MAGNNFEPFFDFMKWVPEHSQQGIDGTGGSEPYVPYSALQEYWTADRINYILGSHNNLPPGIHNQDIIEGSLRIFSTLVYVTKLHEVNFFMANFFDKNIDDHSLPLEEQTGLEVFTRSPVGLEAWRNFDNNQFLFNPLSFAPPPRFPHNRILLPRHVLPLTRGELLSGKDGESSVVRKYTLHKASNLQVPEDTIVVKESIHNNKESIFTFENEINAYVAFVNRDRDTASQCFLQYHGSFRQNGRGFILLEYANQGSLDDFFSRNDIPCQRSHHYELWRELRNLVAGLRFFHNLEKSERKLLRGVHQDLKPSNIFVFREGDELTYRYRFKIGDLGLSSLKSDHDLHTDNKSTKMYGPPELTNTRSNFEPLNEGVSWAADIWSLGCIFFETAVWTVLGDRGRDRFFQERMQDTQQLPSLREAGYSACFHDGSKTLGALDRMLKLIKSNRRLCDDLTERIAELIFSHMLLSKPEERHRAKDLDYKFQSLLDSQHSSPLAHRLANSAYMSSRPATPPREDVHGHSRCVSTASPSSIHSPSRGALGGSTVSSPTDISHSTMPRGFEHTSSTASIIDKLSPPHRRDTESTLRAGAGQSVSEHAPREPEFCQPEEHNDAIPNTQFHGPLPLISHPVSAPSRRARHQTLHSESSNAQSHTYNARMAPPSPGRRSVSGVQPGTQPQDTAGLRPAQSVRGPQPKMHSLCRRSTQTIPPALNLAGEGADAATFTAQIDNGLGNVIQSASNRSTPRTDPISSNCQSPHITIDDVLEWRERKKKNNNEPLLDGQADAIRCLDHREQIFIVDDSKTMIASHWSQVKETVKALTYLVKNCDPNHTELYLASEPVKSKKLPIHKSSAVLDILQQCEARPKGSRHQSNGNMERTLSRILDSVKRGMTAPGSGTLSSRLSLKSRSHEYSIYVLTDGLWNEMESREGPKHESKSPAVRPIRTLVEEMKKQNKNRTDVSIQFIRFGDHPFAKRCLDYLDNTLGSELDFDIVDHRSYSQSSVWRMLIGSISRDWDEIPDRGRSSTDDPEEEEYQCSNNYHHSASAASSASSSSAHAPWAEQNNNNWTAQTAPQPSPNTSSGSFQHRSRRSNYNMR
ncbi:hypothetical protein QBC46DRAFT_425116 [Diplogelasinospora grovesii]|uniref:Protein kinase domain-containing protein n=1 Tax=Diplogelasinospora grovesii TaxID=303347 RepID=A0AAN6NC17_9PEZI|nr:hypothetical protein QBC46DRAFT_425116 [Diplogelasinospora grovesii]